MLNNCFVLFLLAHVNEIIEIPPDHRQIGWNHHHVQSIDLPKFKRLGIGGARHTCQFHIQPKVVLKGGRRQRLTLVGDRHAFLGFNGLMNTTGPPPARHGPACVFVHNDDFVILDDVINILLKQCLGLNCRMNMMQHA